MFKIRTFNNISEKGLSLLEPGQYQVGDNVVDADAYILRSEKLHDHDFPHTLKAVARAGAGVNNIPVEKLSSLGIPVFNTPGANANAVKELVLSALLMAARNLPQAWQYTKNLQGTDAELAKQVEQGKKQFVGFELPGRTLGVVGLGAIGVKVANAAIHLGMKVIGYDPHISVRRAWELSPEVEQVMSLEELIKRSDALTIHVPYSDETHHLINAQLVKLFKPNALVINFARNGLIDDDAIVEALDAHKIFAYVTDFPTGDLLTHPKVIAMPHLGASTVEAEENCAVMAVEQVKDFLLTGNIINSVNFPAVVLPKPSATRLVIANANVVNMVGQISTTIANAKLNIVDMINKSRHEYAYTVVDVEGDVTDGVIDSIAKIKGVLSIRKII